MASASDISFTPGNKTCYTHPQETYQRYCQDCDQLVCIECIIGKHKHHRCLKITEILNTKRAEITQYIKDLKRKEILYLQERLSAIKASKECYSKELSSAKSKLIEIAKRIKVEVDIVRDELLALLQKKEKEDMLFLKKTGDENVKQITEIEKFVQNCDEQIRDLRGTDVLEIVNACKEALGKHSHENYQSENKLKPPNFVGNIDREAIRNLFGAFDKDTAKNDSTKERTSPCMSIADRLKTLRCKSKQPEVQAADDREELRNQQSSESTNAERVTFQGGQRAEYYRNKKGNLSTSSFSTIDDDYEKASDFENSSFAADDDITAPRKDIIVIDCSITNHKPTAIAATTNTDVWVSDNDGHLIKLEKGNSTSSFKSKSRISINAIAVMKSGNLLISNPSDKKISILTDKGNTEDFVNTAPFIPEGIFTTDEGDVLVTLHKFDYTLNKSSGKLLRYTQNGKLKQSIQFDRRGREIFQNPCFVAENMNGDVWVTDADTSKVIVVNRAGQLRFNYSGTAMGTNFTPRGVVCNVKGHGLIAENQHNSVHLVDKDGQFLGLLLTKHDGLRKPYALTKDQDDQFYLGCVGNNKLIVFNFIK